MRPTPLIFVLDDDVAVRDSMQVLLETDGYDVRTFDSVSAFTECLANAFPLPDCVILDVHLPDGDGRVLSAWLVTERPGLPVILMSGRNNGSLDKDATAAGAFAFLDKPVRYGELSQALSRAVPH